MRGVACVVLAMGCSGSVGNHDDNPDATNGGDGQHGDAPDFSSTGGPYFTSPMFWNRDVSSAGKASYSNATISALRAAGGWCNSDTFQIDVTITVLGADNSTPMRSFTKTADFYSPDCDFMQMPVPQTGSVEGETGYACTHDGDCHLLVFQKDSGMLYEMWRANITSS